jgi:7-keto-8-aminopelargonate synthetase-like enzyme
MDRKSNKFIETIYECGINGIENGVFFVLPDDVPLNGRTITINGKEVINWGSCSYLGLESDERVKTAAIEAINKYGVHYSSSRAYSACSLYEEVEHLLCQIFDNNHAVLGMSTTLTHIGAIPILIHEDDLVILDQKVHGSIQVAVQLAKAQGTKVEMIRHSRLDILEDLIKENPNKYNRIWYMLDGVYSMYGDPAPIKDLYYLLDKYSNFYLCFYFLET